MKPRHRQPELRSSFSASIGAAAALPVMAGVPVHPAWVSAQIMWTVAAVIVIVAFGAWLWNWYRRKEGLDEGPNPPGEVPPQDSGDSDLRDRPGRTTVESGLIRLSGPTPTSENPAVEKVFFSAKEEPSPRACPECERTFPGIFDVCPFDSVRLVESSSSDGHPRRSRRLARRFCTQCERRYEMTARYCYHDGNQLVRDHRQAADEAPSLKVCRSCGFESAESDKESCPRDGEQLSILEPAERGHVQPPFPFNRCRRCGHVASPHQTHCPVDGTMMLPELSARLTALPPTGFGQRRRICPECGSQFGDQCKFCSFDGEELVVVN